jgi:hypothetical protein
MMVFSAQLGDGGGVHALPFHSTYPLDSSYRAPSKPLPAKLARYSYLYSPFLSGTHTQSH